MDIISKIAALLGNLGLLAVIGASVLSFIEEIHKPEILQVLDGYEKRIQKITSFVVVIGVMVLMLGASLNFLFSTLFEGREMNMRISGVIYVLFLCLFCILAFLNNLKSFRHIATKKWMVWVMLGLLLPMVVSAGIWSYDWTIERKVFIVFFNAALAMIGFYTYIMAYEISRNESGRKFTVKIKGEERHIFYALPDGSELCGDDKDITKCTTYWIVKQEDLGEISPKEDESGVSPKQDKDGAEDGTEISGFIPDNISKPNVQDVLRDYSKENTKDA